MVEKCFKEPKNEAFIDCSSEVVAEYKKTELGSARKAIFQVRRDLINELLNTNFEE